jgi:hypothetical protein
MSLTRYQVDQALVAPSRLMGTLIALGLEKNAYVDRPNADLNEPIASALESVGVVPADRSFVTDDDLAKVSDAAAGRFIDLAEIRALEGFIAWQATRPARERFPDYSVDRVGASGESLLSILKRKQDRYDSLWKGGGPKAAKMERGIRHTLRMRRGRRHAGRLPLDD